MRQSLCVVVSLSGASLEAIFQVLECFISCHCHRLQHHHHTAALNVLSTHTTPAIHCPIQTENPKTQKTIKEQEKCTKNQ